jgi:phosphoglycerate kinase
MKLNVPTIQELPVSGKKVLVRVDFNVPFDDAGKISDDTRIRAALPTLEHLLGRGARLILLSHLGRPKGEVVEQLRLGVVGQRLAELLKRPVLACTESVGAGAQAAIDGAAADAVVLLENVRFHAGETKGDMRLAAQFAALGDVFVNDAFGTSHREHASVCGIARLLPCAAGLLLQSELDAFARVLDNPARPLVAILGGAKVSDKLPVIANLIERCDAILIGGGMSYTFLAAQGIGIGKSLVQPEQIDAVRENLKQAEAKGCRLLLPTDHVVATEFSATAQASVVVEIPDAAIAMDIGPDSIERYCAEVAGAKTVIWNGPMGVFEWEPFASGTASLGRALAACSGYSVVGGGDSVAAAQRFDLAESMDHISTGGGASLELLEGRVLPGIAALSEPKSN